MTILFCKIFHAVVLQGSFNKAAELLNLTPSAVSHSISSMEKEIGFQLFNRNKAGVTLTGYGEAIYPHIQRVLNADEALEQSVHEMNGLEKGTVKIGTFNSACIHLLPPILKKYQELYPGIAIEVLEGTYEDIISWIKTGSVDIGLLSTSCTKEISIFPIYQDPLVLVAPKEMNIEKGYITVEELNEKDFVIQRAGCDADIQKFLKDYNVKISSKCYVIDDQSTMAMVECGFGVSIMPQLATRKNVYDVNIYPIQPNEYRTIGVACMNVEALSPAAKKMYEHIREQFQ